MDVEPHPMGRLGPVRIGVLPDAVGESRLHRNKWGGTSSSKGLGHGDTSGLEASRGLPLCCKAPTPPVKSVSLLVTKGILMLKACICHKWSELKQFILNNRGGDEGVDLVSVVKVRSVVSCVRWVDHVPKVRHSTCKVGVVVVMLRVRLKDARPTHRKSRPHPKLK
jgi:hypothetical protein